MEATVNSSIRTGWIIAGAVALFLVGLGALAPIPVVVAPYSLVIVVPAFLVAGVLGDQFFILGAGLGALLAPIAFLVFAHYVSRAARPILKYSIAVFAIVLGLSVGYSVSGWENTVRYVFLARANALVAQALAPPIAIAVVGYVWRRNLTTSRLLLIHWVSLVWFSWSAFPWYGELL